ncbi:GNAT family N-acetyltransferase [Streptomyces hygroscopicus]|uniref:GNAT family N-acetyltransferase n=1 Tax=Streptomyces hygroscopicus TaxID=1912 RepID=UPI001FCC1465|nr:GNAT family N-acetyltransferase [Streptomyces hygroscopicus]
MDDLVTARLILHPMSVVEAERMVAGTPRDSDRWPPGYPAEGEVKSAEDFLNRCAHSGNSQPFGPYEIRRRADGQAIGGLGFHGPPDDSGCVTIGYGLIPSTRGSGYASEALRELLLFARARGITRVKGDADHDNIASQRVMTAAGMLPAGEDERVKYYEVVWTEATAVQAGPADPR